MYLVLTPRALTQDHLEQVSTGPGPQIRSGSYIFPLNSHPLRLQTREYICNLDCLQACVQPKCLLQRMITHSVTVPLIH